MKNYKLLSLTVLGIILFASFGCAKDQTVAEYDASQAAKEAAQNAPAVTPAGQPWVGTIKADDGSTVGMIELDLVNQSVPVTASDNTSTQQTVLGGQAQLANVPNSQAQISSANFTPNSDDDTSGNLTATISAKDANGNAQTINLTATISGATTMAGQIQVVGDSTVMTFNATKGASTSTQNLHITSKRAQLQTQLYFMTQSSVNTNNLFCNIETNLSTPGEDHLGTGIAPTPTVTGTPSGSCEQNVEMAIIGNSQISEVNFFNVFTDQPTVQVDISYYSVADSTAMGSTSTLVNTDNLFVGTRLQFPAVTWDLNSKELSSTNNSANGTSRLFCTASGQGWNCSITNLGAVTSVSLVPGQLQTQVTGSH